MLKFYLYTFFIIFNSFIKNKNKLENKSNSRKYAYFIKKPLQIIQDIYIDPIITNDEQVLLIEKFSYICFSNKTNFIIYDFENKKEIFNLPLTGELFYSKKYINYNMTDYIYSINSKNQIIEINLTDNVNYKFYDFFNFLPI